MKIILDWDEVLYAVKMSPFGVDATTLMGVLKIDARLAKDEEGELIGVEIIEDTE